MLTLRRAPSGELVEIQELQPFQELSFEHLFELEQTLGRNRVNARRELSTNPLPVERRFVELELDALTIGHEATLGL